MREILFRGKRIDNGEWVEGFYFYEIEACHCYPPHHRIISGTNDYNDQYGKSDYHPITVDPLTIGQFTGLTDKNGKKIFDGDIVKDAHHTGVVSFGEFNCSCCEGVYGWSFSNGADIRYHSVHEVIGNTHDNPELLGGD